VRVGYDIQSFPSDRSVPRQHLGGQVERLCGGLILNKSNAMLETHLNRCSTSFDLKSSIPEYAYASCICPGSCGSALELENTR
jgi:hypothetical protein